MTSQVIVGAHPISTGQVILDFQINPYFDIYMSERFIDKISVGSGSAHMPIAVSLHSAKLLQRVLRKNSEHTTLLR